MSQSLLPNWWLPNISVTILVIIDIVLPRRHWGHQMPPIMPSMSPSSRHCSSDDWNIAISPLSLLHYLKTFTPHMPGRHASLSCQPLLMSFRHAPLAIYHYDARLLHTALITLRLLIYTLRLFSSSTSPFLSSLMLATAFINSWLQLCRHI